MLPQAYEHTVASGTWMYTDSVTITLAMGNMCGDRVCE